MSVSATEKEERAAENSAVGERPQPAAFCEWEAAGGVARRHQHRSQPAPRAVAAAAGD